jgi:hypothetical protein
MVPPLLRLRCWPGWYFQSQPAFSPCVSLSRYCHAAPAQSLGQPADRERNTSPSVPDGIELKLAFMHCFSLDNGLKSRKIALPARG